MLARRQGGEEAAHAIVHDDRRKARHCRILPRAEEKSRRTESAAEGSGGGEAEGEAEGCKFNRGTPKGSSR